MTPHHLWDSNDIAAHVNTGPMRRYVDVYDALPTLSDDEAVVMEGNHSGVLSHIASKPPAIPSTSPLAWIVLAQVAAVLIALAVSLSRLL